jgi:hypothetical protein
LCAASWGRGHEVHSAGRSHGEKRNIVLPLSARRKTRCYVENQTRFHTKMACHLSPSVRSAKTESICRVAEVVAAAAGHRAAGQREGVDMQIFVKSSGRTIAVTVEPS